MSDTDRLRIAIVIGSTREGRFGPTIATWFAGEAARRKDVEVDVVDLAEARLPEVLSGGEAPAEVAALAPRLEAADAFVVVTPEYNHGYPAALKSAIDWYQGEWAAKPVGFVSYGGMSGGIRAVEQLRQVFAEMHAVTVRDAVSFHRAWSRFDRGGRPRDPDGCGAAAQKMIDQLAWWARALREARARRPYAA